ncbi:MAG: hypothetical protein ACK4MV_20485 [Beijerinckiaceae bacterium]
MQRRFNLAVSVLFAITPAAGARACDLSLFRSRLERAMEPLDHAYIFEDIDQREMRDELLRHVARLEAIIESPPDDCRDDAGGAALLAYAKRLRSHTINQIAGAPGR